MKQTAMTSGTVRMVNTFVGGTVREIFNTTKAVFHCDRGAAAVEFLLAVNMFLIPVIIMIIEVAEYTKAQTRLESMTVAVADLVSRYDLFEQVPTNQIVQAARVMLGPQSDRLSIRISSGIVDGTGALEMRQSSVDSAPDGSSVVQDYTCKQRITNLPSVLGSLGAGQHLIMVEVNYQHHLMTLPFATSEFQSYKKTGEGADAEYVEDKKVKFDGGTRDLLNLSDRFIIPPRETFTSDFDLNTIKNPDADCGA